MAGIFDKLFKKEEVVDLEKLELAATLSFLSIQKNTNLLQFALENSSERSELFSLTALNLINDVKIPIREETGLLEMFIQDYKKINDSDFYIKYDIKIDEKDDVDIYPLILYPLIFNAMVYGYNSMEKYPVRVRIIQLENSLKLEVSNRVNHYLVNQEDNDIINYFKSRLQFFYPEKHSLIINSNSNIFKSTLILNFK